MIKTFQSIYQLQPLINRATTQIPSLVESHLQGLSGQCQELHRLLHLIFKSIQLVAPPEINANFELPIPNRLYYYGRTKSPTCQIDTISPH